MPCALRGKLLFFVWFASRLREAPPLFPTKFPSRENPADLQIPRGKQDVGNLSCSSLFSGLRDGLEWLDRSMAHAAQITSIRAKSLHAGASDWRVCKGSCTFIPCPDTVPWTSQEKVTLNQDMA